MKKAGVIYETMDYDLFKDVKGNRSINRSHYSRLKHSHEDDALFSPIAVTTSGNKYKVIDGQHRLKVRKELGLPVYFYETDGDTIEDIMRLNATSKSWGWKDYLESYCDRNNQHYKNFKKFIETYQFSFAVSQLILDNKTTHGGNKTYEFRSGNFKFPTDTSCVDRAEMICELGQFYRGYQRRSFVTACIIMFKTKGYDHKHMLKQMSLYGAEIVKMSEVDQYLAALEKIYNIDQKKTITFTSREVL